MIPGRLRRIGLAARIGLAIAGAVAAIQLLVAAVFLLRPEPPPPLYGARWVADSVAAAAKSLGDPPVREDDALARLPRGDLLTFTLTRTPPPRPEAFWPLDQIAATISRDLGGRTVLAGGPPGPPGHDRPGRPIVPEDFAAHMPSGPFAEGSDALVPPLFEVAVDLGDGLWLTVRPQRRDTLYRLLRSLAIVFAGAALIGFAAVWTSRSLIAPLSALADAADRLGRERDPAPVARPSIPEFAAISDAFEAMQRRLRRFVDERTQMLAAVSHDLRTPLARLRLQAEYIEDQRQRADVIENITAMQAMLQETLTFVAGDAKSERTEDIDLAAMLITLCDEAADAGAVAEFDGPDHATVPGRRTALRRLFANLVGNAVTYGGCARVALRLEPGEAVVSVSDDGPGIPEHLFDRAFAPFQRLETSRNRESGGTGLGLSIARDIVLGHGGRITLGNGGRPGERGGGLVVTVALPRGR